MKTTFERKPDFRFREFEIEKTVTIPGARFEELLRAHAGIRHLSLTAKTRCTRTAKVCTTAC